MYRNTILLLPLPTVLFTLLSASMVSMTTTAMSFASLLSDIVHQEGDGIIELSNCHWIPLIYCLRLPLLKVFLQILTMNLVHLLC